MTSKSVPIPDAGNVVGGGSPATVRDTPPNILSEESYTVFGSSVCRALLEQNYDVRKKGAREVEDIVKFYQSKGSEVSRQKVTAILVLLARDFLLNPVKDARVGGLIGIAGAAIGLQGASKFYLHLLVPPVVDCFRNGESDMSIKYFAAESLYNILRVAPADCSVYLEEMVSVLIRLWNDTDVSIVKAAECMDTCLRDIAERFATDTQLADVVALLMSELPLILEESSIVLAVPKLYTLHWLKLILQKLTRTVKVSPLIPRITTFAAMPLSSEQRKVVLQLLTMGTESLIGRSSCDATSDILAMFHDLKVQVEHPGTSDKVRLLDFLFLGMMCGAKSTGGVMTIESIQAAFDEEALGLDSTKLTDLQPNNMNRLMSPNAVFVSEHLPQMVELLQGLMGSWSREELEIFGVLDECMRRLCLKLPFKASETWYRELSAALSSQLKRSHRSNTMVMRSVVNWVTFVVTNDTQWSLSNELLDELICLVCSNQTTDLKSASVEALNALVQSRVHYSRLIRAILSRIKSNVNSNNPNSNQIQFLSLVQLLDDTIYKNQCTAAPDHASWIATIEAEDDTPDAKNNTSPAALSYAQEHMLALAVTLVLVFGKSAQLLDFTTVLKNITKCSHFWSRHPGCILMLSAAAGMPGQALENLPRWTATVVASHLRDLCMVQLEFLPVVLENPHFVSTRLHWKPLYDFLVYVLPVGCVGHKIAVARSSALTDEGVLPSYFAQVSSKTPDWPLNPLSELTISLPSELRKDFSKPDLEVLKHECSAVIGTYWHIILPHFAYNGVLSSQMADLGGRQTAMGVKCHAAMGSQAFGYVGDRRSAMDIVFDGVSCQGKEPHVLMPDEAVVVTSVSPPSKMNSVTTDANMSPSQEISRTQFSNDRNVDIGSVPVSPTTERGLSLQDPEVGGSGVFSSSSVAQEPEQLKRQPKYTRAAEANSVAKDLSVESPSNTNSTDVSPSASQYEVLTTKDRSR